MLINVTFKSVLYDERIAMDSLVELVRMQMLSSMNSSGSSNQRWQNILFLAALSNHKKLIDYAATGGTYVAEQFGIMKRFIEPKKPEPYVIKLRFTNNDTSNRIFREILTKHALEFKTVELKDARNWYASKAGIIQIAPDIFFKLDFVKPKEDKEKKKNKDSPEIETVVEDFDFKDSRGEIFSFNKDLDTLLLFIHDTYAQAPPEVEENLPKDELASLMYMMKVARVTKFDAKTSNMVGEVIDYKISKNLDNVFLEASVKRKILEHIKRFKDKKWYAQRGLPRTLGILLHGMPGCGKTSIIKALAAFMKRRVLIVDFKLVKKVSHLRKIFSGVLHDDENNHTYNFSRENTIFVFEDFDVMSKIFLDRSKTPNTNPTPAVSFMDPEMNPYAHYMHHSMRSHKKRSKKKSSSSSSSNSSSDSGSEAEGWSPTYHQEETPSMSDFLELFDGVIEMDGRITIWSTNKRDVIDPALIRPGRIDLDIEFKPPDALLTCQVYLHMYQEVDHAILKQGWDEWGPKLPFGQVSTAQVVNAFMYPQNEGLSILRSYTKDGCEASTDSIELQSIWDAATAEHAKLRSKVKRADKYQRSIDIYEVIKNLPDDEKPKVSLPNSGCFNWKCLGKAEPESSEYGSTGSSCVIQQWIKFDFLNHSVKINKYSMKVSTCRKIPLSWNLEGSNDNENWIVLKLHDMDESLSDAKNDTDTSEATWKTDTSEEFYRYIRIITTGVMKLSDGQILCNEHYLSLYWIQFIGQIQ